MAGPPGGVAEHVPSVLPAATVHTPVQQSAPIEHASPACPQNDDAWQVPPEQSAEQHSDAEVHPLPSVLHVVLRAAHLPLTHDWLQQSPLTVHATPSELHAG